MDGFNRDIYLRDKFQQLVTDNGIEVIIETGTFEGQSTKEFIKMCPEVHTVEVSDSYFRATANELNALGVKTYLQSSPDFLRAFLPKVKDKKILIFLDAHWNGTPLIEELKAIAEAGIEPIIAIHDFKVPNKDFGFDSYNGQDYEWPWIEPYVKAIYKDFKHYYNTQAVGARRGVIFIEPKN